MRKGWDIELKVGFFIAVGLAFILTSIIVLGGTESLFTRKNRYTSHFVNVEGLIGGAKVVMGGVQIGTVESIRFDDAKRDVAVNIEVTRNLADWIRADSYIEIVTQGVLGDKYVSISQGGPDQAPLAPGSEVPNRSSGGLTQFLSKSDQLLVSLQSMARSMDNVVKGFEHNHRSEIFFDGMSKSAKNLAEITEKLNKELNELHIGRVTKNLNSILEKVNNGTGTLGALVNDPGLYDDAKALMGGANRSRVMRNLVRQSIKRSEESEAQEAKAQKK